MSVDQSRFIHLAEFTPRPAYLSRWERLRHNRAHLLVELVAEFTGVFFYVYAGVGSTASFVLGAIAGSEGTGSLFQIGMAYSLGIVLALTVAAATSGGHFNPGITITNAVFGRFPWRKVPHYVLAQILGAYVACLLTYLQWRVQILETEAALEAAGELAALQFTPSGTAGIFALYAPTGSNLGNVFANEFFCNIFIGLVIFACLDPSNFFVPPAVAPYTIGLAYGVIVWGYAGVGISLNTARDLGARFMALTIWGTDAAGGRYAAIAALTNIPCLILSFMIYEFFFYDSSRVMTPAARDWHEGHKAHTEHRSRANTFNRPSHIESGTANDSHSDHKTDIQHLN